MIIEEKIKHRLVGIVVIITVSMMMMPILLNNLSDENNLEGTTVIESPTSTMKMNKVTEFAPSEIAQIDLSESVTQQQVLPEVKEALVSEEKPATPVAAVVAKEEPAKSTKKQVHKTVETKQSTTKNIATTRQEWIIQLGSFANQKNAEQLAGTLKKLGYNIYTKTEKNASGKNVFRVLMRSSLPRKQLEIILTKLEKSYRFKSAILKKG